MLSVGQWIFVVLLRLDQLETTWIYFIFERLTYNNILLLIYSDDQFSSYKILHCVIQIFSVQLIYLAFIYERSFKGLNSLCFKLILFRDK